MITIPSSCPSSQLSPQILYWSDIGRKLISLSQSGNKLLHLIGNLIKKIFSYYKETSIQIISNLYPVVVSSVVHEGMNVCLRNPPHRLVYGFMYAASGVFICYRSLRTLKTFKLLPQTSLENHSKLKNKTTPKPFTPVTFEEFSIENKEAYSKTAAYAATFFTAGALVTTMGLWIIVDGIWELVEHKGLTDDQILIQQIIKKVESCPSTQSLWYKAKEMGATIQIKAETSFYDDPEKVLVLERRLPFKDFQYEYIRELTHYAARGTLTPGYAQLSQQALQGKISLEKYINETSIIDFKAHFIQGETVLPCVKTQKWPASTFYMTGYPETIQRLERYANEDLLNSKNPYHKDWGKAETIKEANRNIFDHYQELHIKGAREKIGSSISAIWHYHYAYFYCQKHPSEPECL